MKIKPIAAALLTLGTLSSASVSMAGETEDRIAELERQLAELKSMVAANQQATVVNAEEIEEARPSKKHRESSEDEAFPREVELSLVAQPGMEAEFMIVVKRGKSGKPEYYEQIGVAIPFDPTGDWWFYQVEDSGEITHPEPLTPKQIDAFKEKHP